jgi:cobalt/nickel transport system permease protein
MNRISNALYEIHEIDEMAERKTQINRIHPLVKLTITVVYAVCVVSINKYDLFGLLPMMVYPLVLFNLADIALRRCLKKLRIVLPMVCFIGILNPFFDHYQLYKFHGIIITGGMVSMVTLVIKGLYTLTAAFLLIATTGIERLCYALKLLRVPDIIVTQILLVYRYITVLLGEANAVSEAYSLRAPKEKGVKYKIWGSLLGQLLFRSIDRAEKLYDSMLLRGFKNEYYYANRQSCTRKDYIYLLLWLTVIAALRILNITEIIGMFR